MALPEHVDQTYSYQMTAGETTQDKHTVVALDTSTEGYVVNPAAADGNIAGVLRSEMAAGDPAQAVQYSGIGLFKLASAVSIGDECICSDALGRIEAVAGAVANDTTIICEAREDGVEDDVISCRMIMHAHHS